MKVVKEHNKKFQKIGITLNIFRFTINLNLERENEISKNNAFLIKNLLEISNGKRVNN